MRMAQVRGIAPESFDLFFNFALPKLSSESQRRWFEWVSRMARLSPWLIPPALLFLCTRAVVTLLQNAWMMAYGLGDFVPPMTALAKGPFRPDFLAAK
jgi:hypothetical protein